jgi:hypothetical protein
MIVWYNKNMKIIKTIKTFFIGFDKKNQTKIIYPDKERALLEKKVIKGTDFAIREYGEVFKKLAEYDRTLN